MPEPAEVRKVIGLLKKRHPGKGMLEFRRAEDVLLAVTLSARTRDEQVLLVYPRMRKRFPTLKKLAQAKVTDIAKTIDKIGLYRNKARFMKGIATALVRDHGGKVPRERADLEALPGVGRKTASCVLSYAFGVPAIAVDTHVNRITHRLGWVRVKGVGRVERKLMELIPEDLWLNVNRVFVQHGREICNPIRPKCYECPVIKYCKFPNKTKKSRERS